MNRSKCIFTILAVLVAHFYAFAQTPGDTTTPEKLAKYKISRIRENSARTMAPADFREALNAISDLAVRRVPYLTMAELRQGKADTARVVQIVQGGRSGVFVFDQSDVATPDDSAMTLVAGKRRYKRQAELVSPRFFGAIGDSATNDTQAMQRTALWAKNNNRTVTIDNGYSFRIAGIIDFYSNVQGFGRIKIGKGAGINIRKAGVTVSGITVDGYAGTESTGTGLKVPYVSRVTFDNVKVVGVGGPGFWFSSSDDSRVLNCYTRDTRGAYGDGVYFGKSKRCSVVNTACSRFQRIGITFEQNSENAIVTNCTARDAIPNGADQINGGIWGENVRGMKIEGNTIENTIQRGIVVNAIVDNGRTYDYILAMNTVYTADIGISCIGGDDQNLEVQGGSTLDCPISIYVADYRTARISGVNISRLNVSEDKLHHLITLIPTNKEGKKSTFLLENCSTNRVLRKGGYAVTFGNNAGYKCDFTMKEMIGNFSVKVNANFIVGRAYYERVTMDYSNTGNAPLPLTNFGYGSKYVKCDIKLSSANAMVLAHNSEWEDTTIESDKLTRLEVGVYGGLSHKFVRSQIKNIELYNIRRPGTAIHLEGCNISGYGAQGFLNSVVVPLGYFHLADNKFASTAASKAVPVQLGLTATDMYISANDGPVGNITNMPNPKTVIPWHINANGNTVPTKTAMNASYGNLKAGSVVTFPNISGGAREYKKLVDENNSDWKETIWSNGVSALLR